MSDIMPCQFISQGKQCQENSSHSHLFCSLHQEAQKRIADSDLFELMTLAMKRGGEVIDQKLHFKNTAGKWDDFINSYYELLQRGYSHDDILDRINKLIKFQGTFDGFLKQLGMPVEPKWKQFEKLVAKIHELFSNDAKITVNDKVIGKRTGQEREIDISIKFAQGFYEYFLAIECKDYKKPVSIDKIEAFSTKLQDIGANKGIVVSSKGFQEGAIKSAGVNDIELYTFEEIISGWTEEIKESIIGVPFITEILFDNPPGFHEPNKKLEGGFRLDDIILYNTNTCEEKSFGIMIAELCLWALQVKLSMPAKLSIKLGSEFYLRLPITKKYVPVAGYSAMLERHNVKAERKLAVPPKLLKYSYKNVDGSKSYEFKPDELIG
jgi:hypothetical protein